MWAALYFPCFFYMGFGREVVLARIYIFLIDIMLTEFLSPDA